MKKRSKRHTKKIRNLIVVCTLSAVILAVSTYAWFIGMKTVNVSSFDIDIATTEGLFLSMDGQHWSYKLDAKNATPYVGNTNSWAPNGLIPVSTVGDMDSTVSRMILFEKGSLTTTRGGYRLLTSRVHNYDKVVEGGTELKQGKGYVVFDLFIKNLSGPEYYPTNEPLNEEAVYLTVNSSVTVADAGSGGIANTGIENSVRVAFTQIGRVKADTTLIPSITGITCSDVAAVSGTQAQVTGICRDAQIWEPNDKAHVTNAINWYDTSCSTRKETGTDVSLVASYNYGTACGTVENNHTYPTYAISRELGTGDNVDVYDGLSYNTYIANTKTYAQYKAGIIRTEEDTDETYTAKKNAFKLVEFPYFTDTMKNYTSTTRPTFMTLAPNSITKVRVYVYIEGQDVDNYDFASLGKKISIKFGFTKERYKETDIEYSGPSTNITDETQTFDQLG